MTSSKKTILIFIDWYEPGYKAGGPIRSVVNLISHLQGNYNFKIITRNTDYREAAPYPGIDSDTWIKNSESVSTYYVSEDNLSVKSIKKLLRNTEHDILYLNSLFSFYFALVPCFFKQTKVLLAVRGMLSSGALGVKSTKKSLFLKASKLIGLFKNVTFQATTSDEEKSIAKYFKKNKIVIASNLSQGVIYPEFKPSVKKDKNILHLFFLGRISPEKNTLYAINLVNKIENHEVHLDLYGAINDKEYYEKCQDAITKSPKNISVTYKGLVKPTDLSKTLIPYHALLFPSTGENYGHAIIESLLNKKPVIISDKTPWQNNDAVFAYKLDQKDDFISKLNELCMMDDLTYQYMAKKSLAFGNDSTRSEEKINAYLAIFDNL